MLFLKQLKSFRRPLLTISESDVSFKSTKSDIRLFKLKVFALRERQLIIQRMYTNTLRILKLFVNVIVLILSIYII